MPRRRRRTDRLTRPSAFTAHAYIALVCLGGIAAVVAAGVLDGDPGRALGLTPALLALGVVCGELLPLKVRRPGAEGEVTPSTTFTFGLLLVLGYGAVPVLFVVSAVCDRVTGKAPVKVAFNASQYAITGFCAAAVLATLAGVPASGPGVPFEPGDLGAIILAAAVWFIVNSLLVGTIVALLEQQPILVCLSEDLLFQATSAGLLLGLSPMVVISAEFSPLLLPLFALPLLSIVQGQRQALKKEHEALHDALTGLPNRVLFKERVAWAVRTASRDGGAAAVMLIDLDGFKEVNDTLGHHEGDRLLVAVARRLRDGLRAEDLVARLGGDEFAVLLSGADHGAARRVAGALHELLRRPIQSDEAELVMGGSIGIAVFPEHGEDVETLIQHADVAMYRAKRHRAGVDSYDPDDAAPVGRTTLGGELEGALAAGELVPYYQPVVDVATGEVTGVEALLRWPHPTRGVLPPGAFIPLAEQSGLIVRVTESVLDTALRARDAWAAAGQDLSVAVNLSPRSLLDRRLPHRVAALLERTGSPPDRLELEVTESMLMADPRRATALLETVRAMGVTIAIDDFGTGHSSLERLRRLPVDVVKVDRSFVIGMRTDETDGMIVQTTIELCHHLGLAVVAEGVEDEETLERLRSWGCDAAQGYHVGRPVPADELLARLAVAAVR